MNQATELIAKQYLNAAINKNTWGNILFNVKAYNAVGDGSDDTAAIQNTINAAIAVGVKAVFFPHGNYVASLLTGLDQVVLFGDNATLTVGGSSVPITQLGAVPLSHLYRDILINGNFDVWQRGNSLVSGYLADRWYSINGTTITFSKQAASPPNGSSAYARVTITSPGGFLHFGQCLESDVCNKLKGKTISIGVQMRKDATYDGQYQITVEKNSVADTSGGTWSVIQQSTPFTLTTSWAQYKLENIMIPADANGLRIQLTAVGGNRPSNSYAEFAQAQCNVGSVLLPFQPKRYVQELQMCQRYYEPFHFPSSYIGNGVTRLSGYSYKAPKRIAPTVGFTTVNNIESGAAVATSFTAAVADNLAFAMVALADTTKVTAGLWYDVKGYADAEL